MQDPLVLAGRDLRVRVVEDARHAADLGRERRDRARPFLESGQLVGRGHQVHGALAGEREVTHHQVPGDPGVEPRMPRAPPARGREARGRTHDLDRERRCDQAGVEREQPVERAPLVQAQHRLAVRSGREPKFHLVPVVERLRGRNDRQHPGFGDPGQVFEGLPDLALLEGALLGVVEVLEPASTAFRHVRAPGRDPAGGAFEHGFQPSFGITPSHPCESGLDAIAGQSAIQEDHAPFVTRERLTSEDEVGNREDLQLVDLHGGRSVREVVREERSGTGGRRRAFYNVSRRSPGREPGDASTKGGRRCEGR